MCVYKERGKVTYGIRRPECLCVYKGRGKVTGCASLSVSH